MTNQSNDSSKSKKVAPQATMLLSGSCAFCPSVLEALSTMIKSGELSSLNIINLEQNPAAMQEYKVRSVPWVRIGKHELTGSQTLEALQQRAQWAMEEDSNKTNTIADFDFLLSDGQVAKVTKAIQDDSSKFSAIMTLLGDTGTVLSTRIGIGVIFEAFAGSDMVKSVIPQLANFSQHDDRRIRADAFHYLGMTADKSAIPILEAGKEDEDTEVREIISDSLEELSDQSLEGK